MSEFTKESLDALIQRMEDIEKTYAFLLRRLSALDTRVTEIIEEIRNERP